MFAVCSSLSGSRSAPANPRAVTGALPVEIAVPPDHAAVCVMLLTAAVATVGRMWPDTPSDRAGSCRRRLDAVAVAVVFGIRVVRVRDVAVRTERSVRHRVHARRLVNSCQFLEVRQPVAVRIHHQVHGGQSTRSGRNVQATVPVTAPCATRRSRGRCSAVKFPIRRPHVSEEYSRFRSVRAQARSGPPFRNAQLAPACRRPWSASRRSSGSHPVCPPRPNRHTPKHPA